MSPTSSWLKQLLIDNGAKKSRMYSEIANAAKRMARKGVF
jgi:hypothetical protein